LITEEPEILIVSKQQAIDAQQLATNKRKLTKDKQPTIDVKVLKPKWKGRIRDWKDKNFKEILYR